MSLAVSQNLLSTLLKSTHILMHKKARASLSPNMCTCTEWWLQIAKQYPQNVHMPQICQTMKDTPTIPQNICMIPNIWLWFPEVLKAPPETPTAQCPIFLQMCKIPVKDFIVTWCLWTWKIMHMPLMSRNAEGTYIAPKCCVSKIGCTHLWSPKSTCFDA